MAGVRHGRMAQAAITRRATCLRPYTPHPSPLCTLTPTPQHPLASYTWGASPPEQCTLNPAPTPTPPSEQPKPVYERPSINYPKFGSSKSSSGSGGASRLDAIPRRKPGEAIIKEMEEEKERMRTEQRPQPKGKGGGGGPGVSVRLLISSGWG